MVKLMQEYLLVNSKLLFIALQVFTKKSEMEFCNKDFLI